MKEKLKEWFYDNEDAILTYGTCMLLGVTYGMLYSIGYANGVNAGRSELAIAVLDRALPAADAAVAE